MCKSTMRAAALEALTKAAADGRITGDLQNQINNGNIRLQNGSILIRKAVGSASGKVKITDNSDQRTDGVTNLNNGKLPKGTAVIVTHISFGTVANADVNGDEYSSLVADPEVYASHFDLSQDSVEFFKEEPIANYHVGAAPTTPADQFVELAEPIVFADDSFIDLQQTFPGAAQASTNVQFIFKGYRTGRK